MNNQDFIKEAHQYLDDTYEQFQEYQSIVLDILFEVDRICRGNNIHYYLAFGTLLGAIRDGGQIPWDYDVDLEIPITEREKFLEILRTQLGMDYYYAYLDNTKNYPTYCIRVGKKGYHFNALHVDVFFLIGCPEGDDGFLAAVKKYCDLRLEKYADYWFNQDQGFINKVRKILRKIKYLCLTEAKLEKMERELINREPYAQATYCCTLGRVDYSLKKEYYGEGVDILFSNRKLIIPIDYEKILNSIYKDYHEYLPIGKRFDEFYSMTKTVTERKENFM